MGNINTFLVQESVKPIVADNCSNLCFK